VKGRGRRPRHKTDSFKQLGAVAVQVQGLQGQGGGKMGAVAAKFHPFKVAVAGSQQAVHHVGQVLLPIAPGSEHDWAGAHHPSIGRASSAGPALAPAVVVHFQIEGGSAVEVGLEGKHFLPPAPAAEQPVQGHFPR
jgi:hypothetical protein